MFGALDLEAVQQLTDDKLGDFIESGIELFEISFCFNGKAWQIDACEAQIAASAGRFPFRVVDIAHDTCAAAHIGYFRIIVTRLIVLQVERCIKKAEVREKAFGRGFDGKLEEIIVWIAFVIIHALFDLEDLYRENRCFSIAKTGHCRSEQVAHDHAGLGRGIRAIVDGAERNLRTSAGVHGVEIMDEGFHGLIGCFIRGIQCSFNGIGMSAGRKLRRDRLEAKTGLMLRQEACECLAKGIGCAHRDIFRDILADFT